MTEEKHFEKPEEKKSWFRKHPILTAVIGIVLLSIIIGLFSNSNADLEHVEDLEEETQTEELSLSLQKNIYYRLVELQDSIAFEDDKYAEKMEASYIVIAEHYNISEEDVRGIVIKGLNEQWLMPSYTSEDEEASGETEQETETQTTTTSQTEYYKVTYVVDGDTIEIETGERVRLICIDTPETNEYYYQEAKDYLKSLILNKEVKLEKDISETDRYGRLLRYIYFEDDFVNELIVLNGYGKAYPYSPDTTLCPAIQSAESKAKNNNLGIWAEQEEEEEPEQTGDIICSSDTYNCGDFQTHAEAQEVFDYCESLGKGDLHKLDRDEDGNACESLP